MDLPNANGSAKREWTCQTRMDLPKLFKALLTYVQLTYTLRNSNLCYNRLPTRTETLDLYYNRRPSTVTCTTKGSLRVPKLRLVLSQTPWYT